MNTKEETECVKWRFWTKWQALNLHREKYPTHVSPSFSSSAWFPAFKSGASHSDACLVKLKVFSHTMLITLPFAPSSCGITLDLHKEHKQQHLVFSCARQLNRARLPLLLVIQPNEKQFAFLSFALISFVPSLSPAHAGVLIWTSPSGQREVTSTGGTGGKTSEAGGCVCSCSLVIALDTAVCTADSSPLSGLISRKEIMFVGGCRRLSAVEERLVSLVGCAAATDKMSEAFFHFPGVFVYFGFDASEQSAMQT